MIQRVAAALLQAALLVAAGTAAAFDAAPPVLEARGSLQAAFAPWDDIDAVIGDAIGGARKQVLVQAYLLTSRELAQALIAARRRGVDVRVLLDAAQSERTNHAVLPELAAAGIGVWFETKYQNAHNKVIVIDGTTPQATVITGSFNFTWTAQHRNAENILVARNNPALAARYLINWERHRQDAAPYEK
jgi:phosphatidylserine/phosphatidylglycerophosphate/cardiolipin synthase-like enzyme